MSDYCGGEIISVFPNRLIVEVGTMDLEVMDGSTPTVYIDSDIEGIENIEKVGKFLLNLAALIKEAEKCT